MRCSLATILLLAACDTSAPPEQAAEVAAAQAPLDPMRAAHETPPTQPQVDESAHPYEKALAALRAKDNEAVIRYLKECVEAEPDNARCHRSLGVAYTVAGRRPQAALAYRRYLELQPQAEDAAQVKEMLKMVEVHQ